MLTGNKETSSEVREGSGQKIRFLTAGPNDNCPEKGETLWLWAGQTKFRREFTDVPDEADTFQGFETGSFCGWTELMADGAEQDEATISSTTISDEVPDVQVIQRWIEEDDG